MYIGRGASGDQLRHIRARAGLQHVTVPITDVRARNPMELAKPQESSGARSSKICIKEKPEKVTRVGNGDSEAGHGNLEAAIPLGGVHRPACPAGRSLLWPRGAVGPIY